MDFTAGRVRSLLIRHPAEEFGWCCDGRVRRARVGVLLQMFEPQ